VPIPPQPPTRRVPAPNSSTGLGWSLTTLLVVASLVTALVVGTATAADPSSPLRYDWDGGLEGWTGENSLVTVDTTRRHGSGSLKLSRRVGDGWSSLRAFDGRTDPRDLPAAGNRLAAHAWVPPDSPGSRWTVRLQVQDEHWTWHMGPVVRLQPGRWKRVRFTIPAEVGLVRRVGVQFEVTGADAVVEPRLDSFRQGGRKTPRSPHVPIPAPPPPPPDTTAPPPSRSPAPEPAPAPAPLPDTGPIVGADALERRVLSEQQAFVDWLARTDAKGFVGEVGWPNDESTARWNGLASKWYAAADHADLWVTAWATGEWWGPYNMAHYHVSGGGWLDAAAPSAAVLETHKGGAGGHRGINLNGGEFGIGRNLGTGSGGPFSNVNRGTYDESYHYDSQASMDYLASRGVKLVRLPFRWERIQPSLGSALDRDELDRLRAAIDRAHSAGLQVIPTVMNYGAYWLHDSATNTGLRTPIGSGSVSSADFADLWQRLARGLADSENITAWGLMNEPTEMPGGASTWEQASQAAVDAIRSTGDRRTVAVPGYSWSTVTKFATEHPRGPWVVDATDNVRYEAHHYFDANLSGDYRDYDTELSAAVRSGY
jgi:hypothetical protein